MTSLNTTLRFAPAQVEVEQRADGSAILRSPGPLRPFARASGEWLVHWAAAAPDRTFLGERSGDGWRTVTYAGALDAVRRIGGSLLARGLTSSSPVAILSDNSVNHALLTLGAMHVGIPVAPISPAYSLMSTDHVKLKTIVTLLQPGLVFAEDAARVASGARFAPALAAVGAVATPLDELLDQDQGARADEAFAAIGPDTVAKILFTTGSTAAPNGEINTQRMLCSNQQAFAQAWPFLEDAPYLRALIENPNHIGCHTLSVGEAAYRGTQSIEREVVELAAEQIFRGQPGQQDGYIASGGTEANLQAMWVYRNYFIREHGAKLSELALLHSDYFG